MTSGRFALGAILIAFTIMIIAGFVTANQAAAVASSSSTTITQAQTVQNDVVTQQASQQVMKIAAQTSTVTTHGNGTLGVYWQVANYTIVPVSNGIQPIYLGSHDDLYIPMHVMDWYTMSCGTQYNITGTIYWYNYYPPYSGVGNLEVYTNSARGDMTGTLILAFNSTGTTSLSFSSLFTAC